MTISSASDANRDLPTVELCGLPLHKLDQPALIGRVLDAFQRGEGGWMFNPNIDCLRLYHERADIRDVVSTADLVVADGVPVVWATRVGGDPLDARVAGSSLIWHLCRASAECGVPVFLLGGNDDDEAAAAATNLADQAPELRIGWHAPPFDFEDDGTAMAALEAALEDFGPAIVFCGLGMPKQERLMATLTPRFPHSWFLSSGASISFAAGAVSRAPAWMQDRGLEWVYRLVAEPRRLWRRYLVHDVPFAARLFLGVGLERVGRKIASPRAV